MSCSLISLNCNSYKNKIKTNILSVCKDPTLINRTFLGNNCSNIGILLQTTLVTMVILREVSKCSMQVHLGAHCRCNPFCLLCSHSVLHQLTFDDRYECQIWLVSNLDFHRDKCSTLFHALRRNDATCFHFYSAYLVVGQHSDMEKFNRPCSL